MSQSFKGSLMVLTAGVAWGISGVSGQYLMAHGVDVNLLTSLRLILAGLILSMIALIRQKERLLQALKSPKTFAGIALFALFGLVFNQYAYLTAIRYTNAGTATVLQYVEPVLILAFVCLKNRTKPTLAEMFAIILAISGTFIIATHGQLTSLAITPKGLAWGLLSAVTYALYILIPAQLIREWGSLIVIGIGMLMGGLAFPLVTQAWRYPLPFSFGNGLALFGLIIVGTVFAYTIFLKGTSLIGPVKGSLLASIEPVASVLFTLLIMKATFHPVDIFGMILIVSAVLLISLKDLIALRKNELD